MVALSLLLTARLQVPCSAHGTNNLFTRAARPFAKGLALNRRLLQRETRLSLVFREPAAL